MYLSTVVLLLFTPLLALLALLAHAHTLPAWHSRNYQTVSTIYNITVYPNNVGIFGPNDTNNVPAGLFNTNATGRISPIGIFNGFQDSIEYFFALAPVAQGPGPTAVFTSAQVVEFSSACPQVASSTVYFVTSVYNPGQEDDGAYISTLKQVAFWNFDETGAVLKYDAWIPNLSNYTATVSGGNAAYDVQLQAATIQDLCGAVQQRCTGNNTQYSSVADCISVLSQKPFGNLDETWGDDVVCRTIHVILTAIRPEVHCPHVGPTGGGKCVDIAYNDAYFDDTALFGQSLAETFMCPLNF